MLAGSIDTTRIQGTTRNITKKSDVCVRRQQLYSEEQVRANNNKRKKGN